MVLTFRLMVIPPFNLTYLPTWGGRNVEITRNHKCLVNSEITVFRNFCDFGEFRSLGHPMLVKMSDERKLWSSNESRKMNLRKFMKFCVSLKDLKMSTELKVKLEQKILFPPVEVERSSCFWSYF